LSSCTSQPMILLFWFVCFALTIAVFKLVFCHSLNQWSLSVSFRVLLFMFSSSQKCWCFYWKEF
jgi:hypothetical protein